MGKKKDVGNVLELDIPPTPKREISEKQRNNLKKGMAILKAKREGLRKEQEEESSTPEQVAPAPVAPPPAPAPAALSPEVKSKRTYNKQPKKESVGLDEFNNFKNELLGKLQQTQPREVVKEVSVEKIVDRPVVTEKVVEREKFVSSSELLNRIFFS